MLLNYFWAVWLAGLLASVLVISGLLNLAGPRPIREGFAKWVFPSWFHLVNGAYGVVAGLMIAWYPTRPFGLVLSLLLCIAIWITLLRHHDYAHLPSSIILFAATLLTG